MRELNFVFVFYFFCKTIFKIWNGHSGEKVLKLKMVKLARCRPNTRIDFPENELPNSFIPKKTPNTISRITNSPKKYFCSNVKYPELRPNMQNARNLKSLMVAKFSSKMR